MNTQRHLAAGLVGIALAMVVATAVAAYLVVMAAFGLIRSWWGLLLLPASVPSIVAVVMHPIASAGNPAFTPASRIALTVSLMQRAAEGCGESTIALRDFTATV